MIYMVIPSPTPNKPLSKNTIKVIAQLSGNKK